MKKLLILILALAAFLPGAIAQVPQKGASAIFLVIDAETTKDAHDIVMRTLIANDIDVRADNQEYYLTKSAGMPTKSGSDVTCSYACMEKDGEIIVRVSGTYKSPLDDFRAEDKITLRGMNGSIARQVWDSMYKTAMLIPHTSVRFTQ